MKNFTVNKKLKLVVFEDGTHLHKSVMSPAEKRFYFKNKPAKESFTEELERTNVNTKLYI